jgi:hypothetical protein
MVLSQLIDEGGGKGPGSHGGQSTPGKSSTIFQKICTSEKYKLYFTEL